MGCKSLLAKPWNIQADSNLKEEISGYELRREIRITRLHTHGLGLMGFREELEKDGHAVRMFCSPESSKGR